MHHDRAHQHGRVAAGVAVAWALIVGAITGTGELIMVTHNGNGNLLGDHAIPHWFAAHRTPALTKPNTGGFERASRKPLGLPRRKAADRSSESVPAIR